MKWAELNTRRLADISRETICLLPIGAIEQHGPHLPVATDQIIAEAMAERVDAACDNKLLLMPSLGTTCSEHHLAFAGTLSIDHNTFQNTLLQMVRSAATHRFHRFFLLNAHGGNMAAGAVVAEQLSSNLSECDVVFATWFRVASERLRPLVAGAYPAVGHACEFETSLIMAVRPELVDLDAIVDDGTAPSSPLLQSDLLTGGRTIRSVPFEKLTQSGVWGKPSLASPEKGEAIFDIVVPTIRQLLAAHWPGAPGAALDKATKDRATADAPPTSAIPLERRTAR